MTKQEIIDYTVDLWESGFMFDDPGSRLEEMLDEFEQDIRIEIAQKMFDHAFGEFWKLTIEKKNGNL